MAEEPNRRVAARTGEGGGRKSFLGHLGSGGQVAAWGGNMFVIEPTPPSLFSPLLV
ncbi:hypothetical protein I7I50_12633 [Histoplasma capsulatum G186AR]|uniref:Uncharacterized protein n=1 Tax=Ajellomyces capsulatus TaxID=5037 RepID=A0A8H8CRR1_AJECA|nr:hypothetical protein I7I52_11062 [Histoplasma capsulatum]QSS70862.1 hypothetical protein I7I50_12633 [Histoplasma capsulatum G186AR]